MERVNGVPGLLVIGKKVTVKKKSHEKVQGKEQKKKVERKKRSNGNKQYRFLFKPA